MHLARLRVRVNASPLLAGVLLLTHGGAIACIFTMLPGWWIPGAAAAAIVASFVIHLRRDALLLSGDAITSITLVDGAECELLMRNGATLNGSIEGMTFAAPLLTIINVRPQERVRRRAAILLPDSAPPQDLRQVRVWLRHRVRAQSPGSTRF